MSIKKIQYKKLNTYTEEEEDIIDNITRLILKETIILSITYNALSYSITRRKDDKFNNKIILAIFLKGSLIIQIFYDIKNNTFQTSVKNKNCLDEDELTNETSKQKLLKYLKDLVDEVYKKCY